MPAQDFINPIIQAYIAGRAHSLERARFLQEGQLGQQRIEQESERIKNEKNEHEASLKQASDLAAAARDLQKQQIDLEAGKNAFEQKVKGIDLLGKVASGEIKPVTQNGEQPPEGAFQIPGQEHLGYFSPNDPQAILAHIQAEHEAIAKGQSQGSLPAQQTLLTQQGQQAQQLQQGEQTFQSGEKEKEHQFESAENLKKINAENDRAKLEIGSRNNIAAVEDATRRYGINAQYQPSPEALSGMVHAGLTGESKLDWKNPQEKAALTAINESGAQPLDPKDADAFRLHQQLVPVYQKMLDFANKLPKNGLSAFGQGIMSSLPGGKTRDLNAEYANIASDVNNIGRGVEGVQGRALAAQIQAEFGTLPALGQTQDVAMSHIDNVMNQDKARVDALRSGKPKFQTDLIDTHFGIKPLTQLPTAHKFKVTAIGKNNHILGSDDATDPNGKDGNWYDTQTGKLVQ